MMAAQVWDANLPPDWTSAATSDGRIFFLNDVTRESTWLHPVTQVTVQTGHRALADLPQGWERGVTTEGVPYYIDHNNQRTALVHPITGRSDVQAEAIHSSAPDDLLHNRYEDDGAVSSFPLATVNGTLQDSKKQGAKKSTVGSWVKGPCLKRPSATSIALQGWLSKQGSDGLQLWKRRWFVLSDYCLYYYKNPQEDKVLGYIPLPSFKIRPVCPEDRIFKRYAFKAEHENTRTYFFAADTKELMTQWMNALSLASILQKDTTLQTENSFNNSRITSILRDERPSLSSATSSNSPTSPSADDSDSGFDGYRSKRFQSPESKSPAIFESVDSRRNSEKQQYDTRSFDEASESSKLNGDRLNTSVDSCQGPRRQPFYANAPPKPRRLNSSYEHSSTPDRSPVPERREPIEEQSHHGAFYPSVRTQVEFHRKHHHPNYPSSAERRTPEAYGATSTLERGDYEDVYGNNYESPPQNPQYDGRLKNQFLTEELPEISFEREFPVHRDDSLPRNWHQNINKTPGPPRSHSADFLEYDRRHGPSVMFSQRKLGGDILLSPTDDQRSKSSVGYHQDGDFWSEENYAAKMRESSFYRSYLESNSRATPTHFNSPNQINQPQHFLEQRVPPAGAATPDLYVPQNMAAAQMSPNTSYNSLKRGIDAKSINSVDGTLRNQSPVVGQRYTQGEDSPTGSGFLRSASARISRTKHGDEYLNTSFPEDGPVCEKKFQQREESMKRLLEWKQRMLQSPLTRKSCSRPESSASSTTSSKINNPGVCNGYPTTNPHYESESYRQLVLQELTSQEMRNAQQLTNGSEDSSRNKYPTLSQGERPAPQGGSEEPILDSSQNRKKDSRREASRTRHLSEERRSTSASSKHNSYSSDEQDVIEERNARRKSRKNSRRNEAKTSSVLTTEPRKAASSKSRSVLKSDEHYDGLSHDYVNIDSLANKTTPLRENETDLSSINGFSGSQRAIPVYIDDKGDLKGEKTTPTASILAKRDPYYVSDVQITSQIEHKNRNDRASSLGSIELASTPHQVPEPQYENSQELLKDEKRAKNKETENFPIYPNFIETGKILHYDPVYESSSCDSHLEQKTNHNTFQDDNSVGKYSDSGYDTLKTDVPQKRHLRVHPQISSKTTGVVRRSAHMSQKRPETWSPDNFGRSWNDKSKVDEFKIVKEYSYEYITPEKNFHDESNLKNMSLNMKLSSPDLPNLESPSIVQKTQQQNTNRNLVKERIKSFSSVSELSKSVECHSSSTQDVSDSSLNYMSQDESMKNPLTPIPPTDRSSEAYVSNIKEQFVSSSTTKKISQEAQVKNLHDVNGSLHEEQSESSLEYRDLKSPQEIIDFRKNRSNIRKFVFNEDENICSDSVEPSDHKVEVKNKRSVKDLLKSFESKLEDVQDGYNYHKEESKRRFYSDSELLSNGSSSDDSDCDDIADRLPPPPASFLEELRTESKNENNEMQSLIPPPRPPKKPHFGGEIDSRGRPRSIRLSLAESIEESLRIQSESENEERSWFDSPQSKKFSNSFLENQREERSCIDKGNTFIIDMDKPPMEQAPPPPPIINTLAKKLSIEENYLPMSPPKKHSQGGRSSVALSSSNSSLSSKHLPTPEPICPDQFGKIELEEHTYIEMSGEPSPKPKYASKYASELPRLDLSKIGEECFSPESPRYYEIGEKESQHYEYIYKTGSHYESIYMEVPPNSAEMIREEKPKIPNKPHDLKHLKTIHKKCVSDSALIPGRKCKPNGPSDGSSDADDEASKDFDSIEPPKKPRFSLSDTFRPASYYLSGADLSTDVDAHDSSDSDLVPPPPIPPSPTTADDMGTPNRSKKFSFDSKEGSVTSSNYASNDSFKPLTPQFLHKRSESACSLLSNKMKRRPLHEDVLDEFNDDDSFILKSEDIYPSSIGYSEDKINGYVTDKSKSWYQGHSKMSLFSEDQHDLSFQHSSMNSSFHCNPESSKRHDEYLIKENVYENSQNKGRSLTSPVSQAYMLNMSSHSNSMSKEYENNSRDLRSFTKSPDVSLLNSSMVSCSSIPAASQGMERQPTVSYLNKTSPPNQVQMNHQRSSSEVSIRSLSSSNGVQRINTNTPAHVRGNSNVSNSSETSPRTAPYYYSDVIKDESLPYLDESSSTPRTRAYQLNNQRDLEANKRQDIGRKVNLISTSTPPDPRLLNNSFENELRHSIDLFHGKTISTPDQINVYEADTLRKMKSMTPTPDLGHNTKNIYPYGISIKSDGSSASTAGLPSHRRTRSLEGLIDDTTPRQRKPIRDFSMNEENLPEVEAQSTNSNYHTPSPVQMVTEKSYSPRPGGFNVPTYAHGSRSVSRLSSHSDMFSQEIPALSEQTPALNYIAMEASSQNLSSPNEHHVEGASSREGSTSRLRHYIDPLPSGEAQEGNDWEDDSQWREQLRRASLRHTRSLETLDEPKRRSLSNEMPSSSQNSMQRTLTKMNLPSNNYRAETPNSPQKSLDEYHVDYREGLITPGTRNHLNFPDRTRKGLTSLEEYEWDTNEETFRKPNAQDSFRQSFLVDGLPPSTEMDSTKSMDTCPSPPGLHSISPASLAINKFEAPKEGGRPLSPTSNRFINEHQQELPQSTDNAKIKPPAPDLIPDQDVTRLGEVLQRKTVDCTNTSKMSKYGMQSESPLSNYSYGFGSSSYANAYSSQNYQPHPHTNNPYHHYKGDDLNKYNYHSYNQSEPSYNPTYQNYRNQYIDRPEFPQRNEDFEYERPVKPSTYNQPLHDTGDYYNTYRGYGSSSSAAYDKAFMETERLRQEEQMYQQQQELAYQDYADRELAMSKSSLSATRGLGDQDNLTSPRSFMAGVSAGELLGKTHEELVLLLIQLRRHQSALLAARKHTALERESQTQLAHVDSDNSDEHLQRIAYLEEHLTDLDKQYQMGKPLINLVDNMVKLGSLYRGFDRSNPQGDPAIAQYPSPIPESLEFSRQILEKKILAEDRREFDSATPDQIDLEGKVMELYKLEKKLQEESLTIQELQNEKEMLERTLETLHSRAQGTNESLMEMDRRNRHRDYLERELSRMRSHLAVSARRLEETATENNRLEHEMMMLRQKIQSNMIRNAQRDTEGTTEARHIESEMLRVQSLLEDLQKRRMDLSQQIQRLTSTEESIMERRPSPTGVSLCGSYSGSGGRRRNSTWLETDLDRMTTRDRGLDMVEEKRRSGIRPPVDSLPYSSSAIYSRGTTLSEFAKSPDYSDDYPLPPPPSDSRLSSSQASESPFRPTSGMAANNLNNSKESLPDDDSKSHSSYARSLDRVRNEQVIGGPMLDRNALDNKPDGEEQRESPLNLDINDADEKMKRYYGILPKEKMLEPKTVRIVKRESTERKRERFPAPGCSNKGAGGDSNLSYVAEDEMESDRSDIENDPPVSSSYSSRTTSLPRSYGRNNAGRRVSDPSTASSSSMMRPSNLPLRKGQQNLKSKSENDGRPMSAHEQLFGIPREASDQSPPSSPLKSDPPSPVFKSAAAKEIIKEMTWEAEKHRRAVPKEKRRHFTISSSKPLALETGLIVPPEQGARSRDDCDMVRALRPRNHPDVVKSTLSTRDLRFNESTIDTILGAPRKIYIPERYMPDEDDEKEVTAEERNRREVKARAIRKMLTESSATVTKPETPESSNEDERPSKPKSTSKPSKLAADKKEREHILAMNQILAKQVMEKSRMVAARALHNKNMTSSSSDEDLSPMQPLPLVQQRENLLV